MNKLLKKVVADSQCNVIIGTLHYYYHAVIHDKLRLLKFPTRDIYSGHFPPPWGKFLSKLKNREEFEGGLEKKKGKRGEKKKKRKE